MQTELSPKYADTIQGWEAESILRKCVHCGFCNATCPTYQLLGDELDGPRGRIYLMKQLFEGEQPERKMALHLDRCLTCRACETTCPSGVEYGRLLELGRETLHAARQRGWLDRLYRAVVAAVVANKRIFGWLFKFGKIIRPVLPATIKSKIPVPVALDNRSWPRSNRQRKMVALAGCVQASLAPSTNLAAAQVLEKLGISLIEVPGAGCCGAVELHTTNENRAKIRAKALIDTWWPCLDQGIEGFVMTASGCGVTIKEYPHLFRHDPEYLHKGKAIAAKTFDLCEILSTEIDSGYCVQNPSLKVAFHAPCTLQHGQKITGAVESLLRRVGYRLCEVKDSHLCCGSAGTYALLQPDISNKLRQAKLRSLRRDQPDVICTANIGCQLHLNIDKNLPVKHWVELLL